MWPFKRKPWPVIATPTWRVTYTKEQIAAADAEADELIAKFAQTDPYQWHSTEDLCGI